MKSKAKLTYGTKTFQYQYQLIQYLYHSRKLTIADIANYLGLDIYTTTNQLNYKSKKKVSLRGNDADLQITQNILAATNKPVRISDGLKYSHVEYFDVRVGGAIIRLTRDLFERAEIKDGVLHIK